MKRLLACLLMLPALARATDPLLGIQPSTASAGVPSYVWLTDGLQKVRQDRGAPGTAVGLLVNCTQNEVCSFQVHTQAPAGGLPSWKVTLSSLTQSGGAAVIGSTATDILVYREGYIAVTTMTNSASATFFASTGAYPDILIPAVDPYWNQTSNAFPAAVTAGQNQSAWIDVHVPTNAPAGFYFGTAQVSSAATVLANLNITYAVYQWPNGGFMPSTATLRTIDPMGFAGMCIQQYGGPTSTNCKFYTNASSDDNGATLAMMDAATMCLDHRISCVTPYPPINSGFTNFRTTWEPIIKGTQTRTPQILPGAKPTSVWYQPVNTTPTSIQNWMTEAQTRGWNTTASMPYDKNQDEPAAAATWAIIIATGTSLHAASPPMASMTTTSLNSANKNGAQDLIDMLVPIYDSLEASAGNTTRGNYDVWAATHQAAAGVAPQIWTYLDCVQSGTCTNNSPSANAAKTQPNMDVDGVATAQRIAPWLDYGYFNVTGELYFDLDYCWTSPAAGTSACGYPTHPGNNPWSEGGVYYSGGHGDGTLVYPGISSGPWVAAGDPRVIFTVMGSTPIILPSVRLKEKRDGVQDVEIMSVLSANGNGGIVTTATSTVLANSWSWNTSTAAAGGFSGTVQSARNTMLLKMHQLTYPPAYVLSCPSGGICFGAQ